MADTEIKELTTLIKQATPLVEMLKPNLELSQKSTSSITQRRQWFSFIAITLIISAVSVLTYLGCVDGSAATGILGAIAGYIFGNR